MGNAQPMCSIRGTCRVLAELRRHLHLSVLSLLLLLLSKVLSLVPLKAVEEVNLQWKQLLLLLPKLSQQWTPLEVTLFALEESWRGAPV